MPTSTLSGVVWIGGTPCAGKSTIATMLARKYGLETYDLDRQYIHDERFRTGPRVTWWAAHTMDERWLDPTPEKLLERTVASWEERLALALAPIGAARRSRGPLIVEGPGAFPWLVAPVLSDKRDAVFLIAEMAFRDRVVADREARGASPVAYARTSDPDRARANHRERDRRLAARIEGSCVELGLRAVSVRDGHDVERVFAEVEAQFAHRLPAL